MSWVDTARRIVQNHQYEVVDTETGETVPEGTKGGVIFDATSAHLMVQIHDGLNAENRERFATAPFYRANDIAMKIVAKQGEGK